MSIGTILQHHRITLKNLHKLVHLTGKKRGGGCLGCHCKTPKYAAWGTVFSFPCCNECFGAIQREACAEHKRNAKRAEYERRNAEQKEPATMSLDALLDQLEDAGVWVSLAPDNPIPNSLRVSNASRLTDELRSNIRSHREELIRYLSLPLFDRVLMIFGGVEVDVNGRKIKPLGPPRGGGGLFDAAKGGTE